MESQVCGTVPWKRIAKHFLMTFSTEERSDKKNSPRLSPLGLRAQESNKSKACVCFILFVRKKAATRASIIPELPLFDTQHWKRPEERKQAAMKELKEKQALLEQRTK